MSTTTPTSINGYSASVELVARFGDQTHRLRQVGPDEIVFFEPVALQSGTILVDVVIDGHRQTYRGVIADPFLLNAKHVPVHFEDQYKEHGR